MAQQSKGPGASVTWLGPDGGRQEPVDNAPSDTQPPGVDEEREPQSLEEALLGE
jgi:hypothetical protein